MNTPRHRNVGAHVAKQRHSLGQWMEIAEPALEHLDVMSDTCSLDVAEDGPNDLETIADLMSMSRERVRQVQDMALIKLKKRVNRQ